MSALEEVANAAYISELLEDDVEATCDVQIAATLIEKMLCGMGSKAVVALGLTIAAVGLGREKDRN